MDLNVFMFRFSVDEKPATVDPTIPYMRVVSFDAATDTMAMTSSNFSFTFEPLQTNVDADSNVLLRDNAHGLFRLWFILVDGNSFFAKSFCEAAILSRGHFVKLSFCLLFILSSCHFEKLSFCLVVIL